ncbi:hypothetical protein DIC66_16075 [Rhodoferax lacus]|uniref:Fucosyltransferase C-terminal domain-containing protein n=1 Tax=Rhodoferax lacus TaxID=2184758 RepID=A0A3E1R9L5_9BURK|nr:glycosyltransferase family 10 [Rhodoferax lacus]RFO95943.1 hypothetical protein DIC66_16075 [Rhodoferax lacus]
MKTAHLLGTGHTKNSIFDDVNKGNPDNWYYPFWKLKSQFLKHGIELNTPDVFVPRVVDFELHQDAQKKLVAGVTAYVMLYESSNIRPLNKNKNCLKKYRRVFTWRDDWVDGDRFVKFNLPNKIIENKTRGWIGRDKLCCLIAANKSLPSRTELDLYVERVKTIRWFEQNAPHSFDLFGSGWDAPAEKSGLMNRVKRKIARFLPRRNQNGKIYFASYRGRVASKLETMQKYRFSICYENVRDLPGYITEKIWDCFFSGCIPVYWGASNITNYIPDDCFIDRRKFKSHEALYQYMSSMTEAQFICYQEKIAAFLGSEKARPFSSDFFAETIVNTIVGDLEHAK